MSNNKKYFLILSTAVLLLFLSSCSVFALEAKYPRVPGLPEVTETSDLKDYIGYFFGLGMVLAGALAVISFAIGAVQLIMSAENPTNETDAKDRMKGSLLGLVLTLSAFIILRTINLSLVEPSLTPLPGVAGVFYTNGQEEKSVGLEVENVAKRGEDLIKNGFNSLVYKCSEEGPGTGPTLLIWEFPKPGFQGNDNNYSGVNVVRKDCGGKENIAGLGSFKMAFETPGIYYCLGGCSSGDMCSGFMSGANVTGGQISAPFKNKIKSIRIVNEINRDLRYGAVFHDSDDPKRGGFCSDFIFQSDLNKQSFCRSIGSVPVSSSVDIFVWNGKTPETSGDGVEFYSEPWGWNSGQQAGKCFLDQKENSNNPTSCKNLGRIGKYWFKGAETLTFSYDNTNREPEYRKSYPNFEKRPGSIRIKGGYLVALYSFVGQKFYCQTFYKDVPNLNEMEFVAVKNKIDAVGVMPIK